MANMAYCRFRNTLRDLQDCQANIDDIPEDKSEQKARLALIDICREIASDFPLEDEEDDEGEEDD